MIRIAYHRENCRVTVEGHACSAEPGRDLVCAGVSALVYTLAENVRKLESGGKVCFAYARLESGDAEIGCTPRRQWEDTARCLFDGVCLGFRLLAEGYPEYVSWEVYG